METSISPPSNLNHWRSSLTPIGIDHGVEMREAFNEIGGIFGQDDALAADPLIEDEGATADDVTAEILAPAFDGFARDGRREGHRELLQKDRIGRIEMKSDGERIGSLDAGDGFGAMRGEVGGADDRAVILDTLGARGGIEHALDGVLEVGAGDEAAIAEVNVVAQMEGEYGRVGGGLPGGREVGNEVNAGVAVAHQGVEDHLLEHPRIDVVAGSRIEGGHVGNRG